MSPDKLRLNNSMGQTKQMETSSSFINKNTNSENKILSSQRRKIASKNPLPNTGNNMDILKKFRYNFHYWLRNCY